jgi:hypothetical protein
LEERDLAAKKEKKHEIDTFIFRDGLIRLQTVRYTVQRTN